MVKVYYYNSYLTRPYSCSRYCVLCRSYTFSRLNSTLSLCLLKSAKACTTFQSWQQSSPMNGSSTISSNTDMPHQSHSRPFHPCDTTHHISVKNVGHAHDAEHLVQTLQSLCTISTEWEGELYCGLTFAREYAAAARSAICSDTAVSFDQGAMNIVEESLLQSRHSFGREIDTASGREITTDYPLYRLSALLSLAVLQPTIQSTDYLLCYLWRYSNQL
jgi:hypothetical protein